MPFEFKIMKRIYSTTANTFILFFYTELESYFEMVDSDSDDQDNDSSPNESSNDDEMADEDFSEFSVDPARTRSVDPARTRSVDPARTR
ncbi:hypothetical protein SAMN00777080_1403 [Aquiflexum balticum DSM 16537]|uniref:Uncharacterized protein n=2 Tax=Aquiflexum TaxID=280472 RepID=A0A1W2H2J1_9BACT|nr:hypothetical protein SAMN00777080_1403 [Aquiflexum balticum DSM 16537]